MSRIALLAAFATLTPIALARAGDLPRAEPGEVGLSAEKLAELKPALQKLVDDKKIPGAVALVARRGKVAAEVAVGYRDLEDKAPMTEDTIFAIASMSKPITCVATMMLVEQGKIGLDDPVEKYLPELKDLRVLGDAKEDTDEEVATVPLSRPITIRDLLAHRSGFSYGAFLTSNERLGKAYRKARVMDRDMKTIAEQVGRLARAPLAHQPGEGWTYGLSHDVLGRVIEVVSGQAFDQYLHERIFAPLEMRDTAFSVPEAKRDRVATIYRAGDDGALTPIRPKNYGSETFFSGGGGLFSTARDYSRFAQMLLDGGELGGTRILKRETIAEMTRNQIGKHAALGLFKYGLGFGLMLAPETGGADPALDRYFWGGIFSTNFWIDPRREVVAVIMTQVLPTNHGGSEAVFRRIVDGAIAK